jgi:hypothetical protein
LLKKSSAFVARIGEQAVHGIESISFLNHALATEIGHSLDSSDFTGIGQSQPMIGNNLPGMTRRSVEAHGKRRSVDVTNVDPYSRNQLTADAELRLNQSHLLTSDNFKHSWQAINAFIDHDLRFPLGFYICRPHMTYRMLYGIKVLRGKEMGMTLMRPGLFEMADDAVTQKHIGTYTYYSKAVVKNPKHVKVARNIFCNGYDGGTGVYPINPDEYKAASGNFTGQSVICIATAYHDEIDGVLSLTGRLTLGEYEQFDLTENGSTQYLSAKRYNRIYGWQYARTDDQYETQPYDGLYERRYNNVLCHPGHQFYFNRLTQGFTIVSEGKGHFGPYTYLGCDKVRAGMPERFRQPDYSNYIHA